MKHVIPVMQKQGGGSIINISSIASIRHLGISYVSYGALSKAAMNQMTRTTAVEFARDHVRVNAILPGLMKTPMVEHSAGLAASYAKGDVEAMWRARDAQVPMGHMGDAWDVANAALFLASDESKYVTGHRAGGRWRYHERVGRVTRMWGRSSPICLCAQFGAVELFLQLMEGVVADLLGAAHPHKRLPCRADGAAAQRIGRQFAVAMPPFGFGFGAQQHGAVFQPQDLGLLGRIGSISSSAAR
jgi:hypothetical protein